MRACVWPASEGEPAGSDFDDGERIARERGLREDVDDADVERGHVEGVRWSQRGPVAARWCARFFQSDGEMPAGATRSAVAKPA
ncbi:MAG: hypothetical protein AMXMBFR42_05220 [Burkholderiales bacterium]